MAELLANRIKTPDGTILQSYNRHDYKTHTDAVTGETYMVDGGLAYMRRSMNNVPATEMSVYDDAPHAEIREAFCWGTRGRDGYEPVQYKPVKDLTSDHIAAILKTQHQIPDVIRKVFVDELKFRGEYTWQFFDQLESI